MYVPARLINVSFSCVVNVVFCKAAHIKLISR